MCDHVYIERNYDTPLFENPLTVGSKIAETFYRELLQRLPNGSVGPWLVERYEEAAGVFYFTTQDLVTVLVVAVLLSILRYVLNITIFKRIPLWLKMGEDSAFKFPEGASSFLIYFASSVWALYIILTNPKDLFFDLSSHWKEWMPGIPVDTSIYWLYMYQMGVYVHFVFTLLVFNVKRKDTLVLFIHHIVTLCLLVGSFAVRFYYAGFVLVFLLDIGDVILEFSKCMIYLSDLGGKKYQLPQNIANVSFVFFTVQWIFCRLYWFPTKVLQSTAVVSMHICPTGYFYVPFNILLYIIYIMQIYWFFFIVKLLVKVMITGQDVEDTREFKEDEAEDKKDR